MLSPTISLSILALALLLVAAAPIAAGGPSAAETDLQKAPVINLGFSGSGRMEPEMAELLAELDPSVYVLDCLWNMSPDLVSTRIEPFVKTLRAAHPDTPILLAEDCSVRNVCPTEKGTILRKIYEKLTAEGIQNLYFLSNEGMLGDDTEGTVDGCHPNDLGMMRQAEVFAQALAPLLGKGK